MITWPESPMLPPPIARRSTPGAASASASVAIAPGSFFSWTTNWLAMTVHVLREGTWVHGFYPRGLGHLGTVLIDDRSHPAHRRGQRPRRSAARRAPHGGCGRHHLR